MKAIWKDPEYRLITSKEQLEALVPEFELAIKQETPICIDVETTGAFPKMAFSPIYGWLVGMSFSFNKREGYYIPINHTKLGKRLPNQIHIRDVAEILNPVLSSGGIYIAHNAKFDYKFLWRYGIYLFPRFWDTMIATQMAYNGLLFNFRLKDLIKRFCDLPDNKIQTFDDVSGGNVAEQSPEDILIYSVHDVIFPRFIYEGIKPHIDNHFKYLFYDEEMALLPIIAHSEMRGAKIDIEYFKKLAEPVKKHIDQIASFYKNNYNIEIGSQKQLGELLSEEFDEVPLVLSDKGNISTGKEVLQQYERMFDKSEDVHKLARRALKYRQYSVLLNTFINKFPLIADRHNGEYFVYTSYKQVIKSGRMSSSPNFQNLPANRKIDVRKGFVPRKGYVFVDSDYSGAELRLTGAASGEPKMLKAYEEDPINADLHTLTASGVFGIPADQVTPEQRKDAKIVNFSIIYGATEYSVSKTLNKPKEETLEIINSWYETYPYVKAWKDKEQELIDERGYSETFYGRRRYIGKDIHKGMHEYWKYNAAIRALINHIIQGTCADLLKRAIIDINREIFKNKYDAHLIFNVHDSITLEVYETHAEDVKQLVIDKMTTTERGILMPVDIGIKTSLSKAA